MFPWSHLSFKSLKLAVVVINMGKPSESADCGGIPESVRAVEGKYTGFGNRQFASGANATRRREPWTEILGGREERVGAS